MANLFRSVVVPHDFSPQATEALRVAAALIPNRGRLLVLHVLIPYPVTGLTPAEIPYIPPVDLEPQTAQQLAQVVKRALPRRPRFRVTTQVVVGDPADRIIAAAKKADSVIMATHGRSGLAHLLIGSVAEKVVRHSPRPVLTIRAGALKKRAPGGRKATRR